MSIDQNERGEQLGQQNERKKRRRARATQAPGGTDQQPHAPHPKCDGSEERPTGPFLAPIERRTQHEDDDEREQSFGRDRKSTRLNSSHSSISYAVFCLKKKKKQ